MPCWYYDREDLIHTPSFRDQIDTETETRYRREGARFLFDVSNKLKLRYDTCATAIVFFHRFYMSHSFKAFPRYVSSEILSISLIAFPGHRIMLSHACRESRGDSEEGA